MGLHQSSDEDQIERLTNEIAAAFSIAFFELDAIRATAGEFGADITQLMEFSAPERETQNSKDAYQASMENAACAAAAAESLAASLTDRAFQGALIQISGALLEIKKYTVSLKSISYLTKITETEADDGSGRLSAFSDTLDSRCLELQKATTLSSELVGETQRQSGLARDKLTAIGIEFRSLSRDTDEEGERLTELEKRHRAYMFEISETAHQLDEEVRCSVAGLIGCLQFPDSFAQRSEHVCAALGAMRTVSSAERVALGKVAAAQLEAMAQNLVEVCSAATAALSALKAALFRSPTIDSRPELINPSDEWMAATGRANDTMLASLHRARGQFDAAVTLLDGLTGQIAATQENLEISVRLNLELEASVHNASVVAHRSGSRASPFQFLAGSVKDVVDRTSNVISKISGALEHIRGTSEALTSSSLHQDLADLVDLQEQAATDAESQVKNVNEVRELRRRLCDHADRLTGAATAAENAFSAAAEQASAIANLSKDVFAATNGTLSADIDLQWLYASYTMEDERIVHRQVLGLAPDKDSEIAVDEDLDDFML